MTATPKPDPVAGKTAAASNIVSYLTGLATTCSTVALRADLIVQDGNRCHFCRATGGSSILRFLDGQPECYVALDTMIAYDARDGTRIGRVDRDTMPLGRSSRVVLDLAYLDGNPANLTATGRRKNVVLACQRCNKHHGMKAIDEAAAVLRKAEAEAEFGPELPLF